MNITLKNVPNRLHASLKQTARRNGRSLNAEAITALEREYLPRKLDPRERLQSIRELRLQQPLRRPMTTEELKQAISEGRE
jgi:plasmid stability protein